MAKPTKSEEEYLERIYRFEESGHKMVKTTDLAKDLGLSPASVTEMISGPLSKKGLVKYKPYKGVTLTGKGKKIAVSAMRKHRLAEKLLVDMVGVNWDDSHDEACKLEHALSEDVLEKLENVLGKPDSCPHGNIIPDSEGNIAPDDTHPLTDYEPVTEVEVARISHEQTELLRQLCSLGIFPGVKLKIIQKSPLGGPMLVDLGKCQIAVGKDIAKLIRVKPA
ncbi:MAG: metal-dependent transcriptional regulator [Candidatus Jordarchaeum sp.]|uniref:metal-dependent transcriptional regulator n=1 Tax=Candidatus Jordarchaeum sp. TaxID=2823881 RepID=UPI004049429C